MPGVDEEDDDAKYDAAREVYKNRRDAYLRDRFGLKQEDTDALEETGLLDKTDMNLITADATYKLFGQRKAGIATASKVVTQIRREKRSAEEDAAEVIRVIEEFKKIF